MRTRALRVAVCGGVVGVLTLADAAVARAQLVQSDAEPESGPPDVTQLVTSSTEVRRAVIGLLSLAVVAGLLGILYWYKTGQQARDRHARQYGGKHQEPVRPKQRRRGTAARPARVEPNTRPDFVEPELTPAAVGPAVAGSRDLATPTATPRPETTLPTWGSAPDEPGRAPVPRPAPQPYLHETPSGEPYPDADAVVSRQPYPDALPDHGPAKGRAPSRVENLRRDLFGQ